METIDARLLTELCDIVGSSHVLRDDDVTERYRTDWTRRFQAASAIVVRPANTAETAAVVAASARFETAIVPQGGNTGLVGGGVPLAGELVVTTERLTGIEDDIGHAGYLTAGAGTPLSEVQRVARESGWDYGVDIASRATASIGGTIATNAGGLRAIRHGDTRRQVLGVEIVTGTGAVISSMGGTLRGNTGYHLPSLVCGSEGTLGVITRARVRLVPQLRSRSTMLLRFAEWRDAVVGAEALRRYLPSVEAVELFFSNGLELVCRVFALAPPFRSTDGAYVLAEAATTENSSAALAAAVRALEGVTDVAVAEDSTARARLWQYRELHTKAISSLGVPHKLDAALPPGMLANFVEAVPQTVARVSPSAQTWLFGHGGESSVHVNVTGPSEDDYRVDEAMMRLVSELNGTISAEHGIGRAKLPWITLARSREELYLLTLVKDVFDPHRILNPNVLLPTPCFAANAPRARSISTVIR